MTTICRAYDTEEAAREAVDRLLAARFADSEIRIVMGSAQRDARDELVGSFAGATAESVGSFAGTAGSNADAMGRFAGDDDQRRGSFADLDRETVTTYRDGIRRVAITSHRDLQRMLVDTGLDADAAAADVAALHAGRVLVLVRTAMPEPALAALDG